MDVFDQNGFDVRFDWGLAGLARLAPAAVTVVVDVLSFSTAVDVAVGAGAAVYPYEADNDGAAAFAAGHGAELAVSRQATSTGSPYSLSPPSLRALRPGDRVVLPSPNGAALSLAAAAGRGGVLAGCLRNATAVARAAKRPVNVVAAGERWPDDTMRPTFEDVAGAGAIVASLPEAWTRSPEAEAAAGAFAIVADRIEAALLDCASGRELVAAGWTEDVLAAAGLDESRAVPRLVGGAYRDAAATPRPRTATTPGG